MQGRLHLFVDIPELYTDKATFFTGLYGSNSIVILFFKFTSYIAVTNPSVAQLFAVLPGV